MGYLPLSFSHSPHARPRRRPHPKAARPRSLSACSKNAPAECVEFLKYIVSPEVQLGYAKLGVGLPVSKGAESGVSEPSLKAILQATTEASSVQLWLDTQYGSAIGDAMNAAIVKIFDGSGTPADVVTAMKTAAAR